MSYESSMRQSIRGYQEDLALILSDDIAKKTNEDVHPTRIISLLVKHGVVSDFTWHNKQEDVLDDLGFDIDEIFEVAP